MLVRSGVLPARNEHLERLAPWLEHLLAGKPAHHAWLIRPFMHWLVLRRARRAAARRTFTRGSADFARARVLAALDLLTWLDQRGLALHDLKQADLDQWLADGTTTRRTVRYFLQWACCRGLAGDLAVPLPPPRNRLGCSPKATISGSLTGASPIRRCPWTCGLVERSSCCWGCWSAGSSS